MKPIVIFGAGQIAELAVHYFRSDSDRSIVALTVDADYLPAGPQWGLPVVPFEGIASDYPPDQIDLFIALSYRRRNRIRRERFLASRSLGYHCASYISTRATVLNQNSIGENCFILEDNTIQPFVSIGDNTTLWSGNHIGHHSRIDDHVFIASHVVISGNVTIRDGCFLGVNATIRDGVILGSESIIGAGALVMNDVPERSLVAPSGTAICPAVTS